MSNSRYTLANNPEPIEEPKKSRYSLANNESPEQQSLTDALSEAPGKVVYDAGHGALNFINKIPAYYEKAKSEISGLPNTLMNHPLHYAGQAAAGAPDALMGLATAPKNLLEYMQNRLNLLPNRSLNIPGRENMHLMPPGDQNKLPEITEESVRKKIDSIYGQPKYPGEALTRGAIRNIAPIAGAASLASAIPHLTRRGASRRIAEARQMGESGNLQPFNIHPDLLTDSGQFLPNTAPYRNLLQRAGSGRFNDLFELQSDLGKNSGDYARSLFSAAERRHGREGLSQRQRLLDAIHQNLQSQGRHDISDLLRSGQNDYRRYMAFKPYRNALALAGVSAAIPGEYNPVMALAKKLHNII